MGEGQPVAAVGDEGIGFVRCFQPFADFENPMSDPVMVRGIEVATSASDDVGEEVEFVKEGKGGHPAENESDNDDDDGDSDFAKVGHIAVFYRRSCRITRKRSDLFLGRL